MKNEIILYRPNELAEHIEVRIDEDTVWLTQAQMVLLFGRDQSVISKHIRNIFTEGELDKKSVYAKFAYTAADGKNYEVENIVLIDNYIDETILTHLAKKKKGVKVLLLTKNISKQLNLDIQKANTQYGGFEVKQFTQSHDRFLIIDDKEVFHLGASLKDLGKKWFAFSKMDKSSVAGIIKVVSEVV